PPAQRLGGGTEPAGTGQRVRGAAAPQGSRRLGQPGPGVSLRRTALAVPLAAALVLAGASVAAAAPARSPEELLDRLEKAWHDRDLAAYLDLWAFATAEAREEERSMAAERLASEEA